MTSHISRPSPRSKFATLALAGVIAAALSPLQGAAETLKLSEPVDMMPGRAVSAAQARVLSREAAHVVRNLTDARAAIDQADLPAARIALAKALAQLQTIKDEMPGAKVRDRIWTARQHLKLDSPQKVHDDLVLIMSDLDEIRGVVAVDVAKAHIADANTLLKAGDKNGADRALKQASDSLIYTEAELPVNETLVQIDAAIAALDGNHLAAASAALIAAENGMVYVSFAATAPLGNARTSLWQATRDYAAHDYAATKADLKTAAAWLGKATHSTDKVTRTQAARLKADMDKLSASSDSDRNETASALSSLWARSKALSEREAERAAAAWNSTWTKSAAKLSLIDAKLHLAYAETADFIYGTTDDVKKELAQASAYLDQAAKDAATGTNRKLQATIKASKADIAALNANLDDKSSAARAQYQKVISNLRQAIRGL